MGLKRKKAKVEETKTKKPELVHIQAQVYEGPAVTAATYNLYKDNLERENVKRREAAARAGKTTYLAKVKIPAHNNVKEHFAWVEKMVHITKPVNNVTDKQEGTTEAVQPVQGGSNEPQ